MLKGVKTELPSRIDLAQNPYIKFEHSTNKAKTIKITDIKGTFFYPILMMSLIDALLYFLAF